jgi:hypothetical protein
MKRIVYALALAAMVGCAGMWGGAREKSAPAVQVSQADFSRLTPGRDGSGERGA